MQLSCPVADKGSEATVCMRRGSRRRCQTFLCVDSVSARSDLVRICLPDGKTDKAAPVGMVFWVYFLVAWLVWMDVLKSLRL